MRRTFGCLIVLSVVTIGCTPTVQPGPEPERPPTPDGVEQAVREVLAELLNVDAAAISMDQPISDPPLKADDLDLVEIIMELEDRLGIMIADAAVEQHAGSPLAKGPVRITPNQLVSIARESPKAKQQPGKK